MPIFVAEHLIKRGASKVGILGLAYKSDLKVHSLSPTLKVAPYLRSRGVQVKIHDPCYSEDEIKKIVDTEAFQFPNGLKEFEAVVIVAGHRMYKAIPEATILENLGNCRLIMDNVEEAWRRIDFSSRGIEYHVVGDSGWLGIGVEPGGLRADDRSRRASEDRLQES